MCMSETFLKTNTIRQRGRLSDKLCCGGGTTASLRPGGGLRLLQSQGANRVRATLEEKRVFSTTQHLGLANALMPQVALLMPAR